MKPGIENGNDIAIKIDLAGFRETLEKIRDQVIPPKRKPMTVERAVEVLNKHNHAASSRWGNWVKNCVEANVECGSTLTDFEAIAVAEKYERES